MRRIIVSVALFFAGSVTFAQSYGRLDFSIQNGLGQAVPNVNVTVYTQSACGASAGSAATLYPTANGGTPLSNPVQTNGLGKAFAYVVPGCVTVTYSSPQIQTQTYPDQNVTVGAGGISIPVAIPEGGTGATTTAGATANLISPTKIYCEVAEGLTSCRTRAITAQASNGAVVIYAGSGVFDAPATGLNLPSGITLQGTPPRWTDSGANLTSAMTPIGGTIINCATNTSGNACVYNNGTGSDGSNGIDVFDCTFENWHGTALQYGTSTTVGMLRGTLDRNYFYGDSGDLLSDQAIVCYNCQLVSGADDIIQNVNTGLSLLQAGSTGNIGGNGVWSNLVVQTNPKSVALGNSTKPGIEIQTNLNTFVRPQVNTYYASSDETCDGILIDGSNAHGNTFIGVDVEVDCKNGVHDETGNNAIEITQTLPFNPQQNFPYGLGTMWSVSLDVSANDDTVTGPYAYANYFVASGSADTSTFDGPNWSPNIQPTNWIITNTQMSSGTATYTYTGSTPPVGDRVTVTGTTNGGGAFNVTLATIATVTPGTGTGTFTVTGLSGTYGSQAEIGTGVISGPVTAFGCGAGTCREKILEGLTGNILYIGATNDPAQLDYYPTLGIIPTTAHLVALGEASRPLSSVAADYYQNANGNLLTPNVLGQHGYPDAYIQMSDNTGATGHLAAFDSNGGLTDGGAPGGNIPGGALGSAVYQTGSGATGVTLANTSASTLCLTETGTGSVGAAPTWGSCAGSAATAFSALTSSTNTSAAMVVGSGASLDFTGTGTIDANLANGAVLPSSAGFTATNSSRQLVAAAYTPANCTAGTTGSDCLQLTSGLVPVGNIPTAIPIANIGSAGLSGTAPVSIASTGAISMHVADASDNGYLSSTDWSTFNGKQAALSLIKGTYVDGDLCAYTASGTLLNCNVTPGGTGTVTDGSGTTTTPEFAESTGTAHVIQYRTASQALGDMGAQAALSLLAGTYTNGDWCSYASSGTLLNCNNAVPQVNLSLIKGTYVDGDYCTYTASGTVLNCNSTPSGSGTVTSFSAGNLSPLFTTSVATATSTPALTFSLSNAAQNSVLAGPISGGPGAPSYQTAPTISAANMTSFPTFNQATTGKSGGLTGCTQSAAGDICYWNGSAWLVLTGNASGTKYLQETSSGVPSWTTVSGSGLSGMTAGQVPIAATASTVTSSEALAGSGAGIVTGPTSSTVAGDVATYQGTTGQIQDSGTLLTSLAPAIACTTVSSLSPANNGCYNLTTSSSVAMPAASAFTIFTVSTETGATATFTSTTLTSNSNCSGYLSGTTLALTANQTIVVKSDGTNVWAGCSTAAGTGTVTSVATTGPITGGTITGSGTIACATCVVATVNPSAGLLRVAGGTQTATGAELSGDATTSGSNAVTVIKINGGSVPASAALLGTNGSSQPTAVTAGTGVITALGVNTGSAGAFGVLIASGTAAMNTASVGSGACETVVTVSATGVATTDTIQVGFNGDPTAVTGYGASATGAVLTIYPYPTSGNVNFKVCNSTSGSITPGALTLNWRVAR